MATVPSVEQLSQHQAKIDAEIASLSTRLSRAQVEINSTSSNDQSDLLRKYEDMVRSSSPSFYQQMEVVTSFYHEKGNIFALSSWNVRFAALLTLWAIFLSHL
jgi:hypothetical protein